jgi:hypothetical protein
VVVHQCPDPERLLALAGMVRTLEHNWELDFYGPRGLAKARMGERPRIDPEAVRQAQPGEAWVIQAGQSIHLRVLPPPAVTPEPAELAATLPLTDDTIPLPIAEESAPVGIAAAVALAGQVARRVGHHHPDVPQVVIVVASGSDPRNRRLNLGHFAAGRWQLTDQPMARSVLELAPILCAACAQPFQPEDDQET